MQSECIYIINQQFLQNCTLQEDRQYVKKEVENRKRELTMHRVWVQAKFRKRGEELEMTTSPSS
jgi:hypothetical protein